MRPGWAVLGAAAVLAGLAGSALAVRASGYPGPPEQSVAVAAAEAAIGRVPATRTGPMIRCTPWCPEPGPAGVVSYQSPPDRTDVTTVTVDLPAGFARVGGYTRDGLIVNPQYSDDRVHVVVAKAPSVPPVIMAVAGLVVGAALGVSAALAVLRRHRRRPRGRRAIAELVGSVMVAVAAGYAALAVMLCAQLSAAKDVQLAEFILTVFPGATWVAVVAAALAAALALAPARSDGQARPLGSPVEVS